MNLWVDGQIDGYCFGFAGPLMVVNPGGPWELMFPHSTDIHGRSSQLNACAAHTISPASIMAPDQLSPEASNSHAAACSALLPRDWLALPSESPRRGESHVADDEMPKRVVVAPVPWPEGV